MTQTETNTDRIKTAQIIRLLREYHKSREWACFAEIPIATGFEKQRIDFWAMNCYESKGFTTRSYEIKVSRSDWLREIKNPEKRKAAFDLCNAFFFVAPEGIINRSEVPDDCGLVQIGKTVRIARQAPLHECTLPKEFFAGVLRRCADNGYFNREIGLESKIAYLRRLEKDYEKRYERAVEKYYETNRD